MSERSEWPDDELPREIDREPTMLDDRLVEQLIDGIGPDSVPPTHRLLADILASARAPAVESELAGEVEAVTLFRLDRLSKPSPTSKRGRRRHAQDAASSVLSKLGIRVPRGHGVTPPTVHLSRTDGTTTRSNRRNR